jgi:hypothetical protein
MLSFPYGISKYAMAAFATVKEPMNLAKNSAVSRERDEGITLFARAIQ